MHKTDSILYLVQLNAAKHLLQHHLNYLMSYRLSFISLTQCLLHLVSYHPEDQVIIRYHYLMVLSLSAFGHIDITQLRKRRLKVR
jgi:hypothetical protein